MKKMLTSVSGVGMSMGIHRYR